MTPSPFTRTPGKPRDPARIDIVLSALRAYWLANPDLRLGQIVVNAADGGDPFGVEDDMLMAGWPEQEPMKAPRTCWTCEGCRHDTPMACTHPDPRGDIGRWQDATPTAPCPGFTERT